ncbi:MAG TPA: NAD(P)-dependent oxidoreductase [Candidatus Limnocylindria bacterium]|nr:NAD(P)-dependent oxidoreductase [Candidatus Limnocylindria bacterium]
MQRERLPILVTGSSGLIGSAVMRRLAQRYEVVGFSRHRHPDLPGSWIGVDMADDRSVASALDELHAAHGSRLASVIHLAAYYDFSGAPSPLYQSVTVDGTRRLLDGLHARFEVEQLVFSSSMLVQAPSPGPGYRIDENDPLSETWDYPRSKVRTERLIRERRGTIPAVIERIAGIYDGWCHSIPISHQIARIFERDPESYLFPGDPDHGQAFVHVGDCVDAIEAAVERRTALPDELTVLIGEPITLGYDELQDEIGRLLYGESDWPTVQIPKVVARAGAWVLENAPGLPEQFIKPWMIEIADDHYELDLHRANEILGWRAHHRLAAVLPEMIGNLLRDPLRWYRENDLDPGRIPRDRRRATHTR